MNRDIALGLVLSLLFHGSLLWVGASIQREIPHLQSPARALDLSIFLTSPNRENRSDKPSAQRIPRRVSSSMPIPLRSSPKFVEMKELRSRPVLVQKVTRTQRVMKARPVTKKTLSSNHITSPRPIQNAKLVLNEADLSRLILEKPKTPSPGGRMGRRAASRGEISHESARLSNKQENLSGVTQEARVPDRRSLEITEAAPDYTHNPKPVYPRLAIRRGHEGTVTLLVKVLPDGSVGGIEILKSSGHPILDRSALKTVRKWRFRPGTRMGKPVAMKVKVPVVFRLNSDASS